MKRFVIIILALSLVVSTILIAGCEEAEEPVAENGEAEETNEEAEAEGEQDEAQEEVKMAHGDWACATAKSYLVGAILEQEMGYEVELTQAELGMIYTDMANGNQDINIAGWFPVTHEEYYDEYSDEIDKVSTVYEGARIGLVVPEYVDVDSIEELDEHADEFESEIVGIDSGAGIMQASDEALETYDSLADFDLQASSEAAMVTELQRAIENEEGVVVTGWTPHWKFGDWELKFLEDPEGVYGEEEYIEALTRAGFGDEQPEVVELLENFYVDDDQLGELMGMIDESGEPMESSLEWMEENQDLVDEWIPQ